MGSTGLKSLSVSIITVTKQKKLCVCVVVGGGGGEGQGGWKGGYMVGLGNSAYKWVR